MSLPSPVYNVPRHEVGGTVAGMLLNPDVGDVACTEQANGTYAVTPRQSMHPPHE